MMLDGIGLFRGIMAKMNWLDQNQTVVAKNIANADTPGFRPMSLKDEDFSKFMGTSLSESTGSMKPLSVAVTDSNHIGAMEGDTNAKIGSVKQKKIYEASPDGNGVVLEEQLFKSNENGMQYQIATDLYRRSAGMIRMALQGSGR